MGFFSTKKTVSVASTVYSMTGDPSTHPNFNKLSIFSAIIDPYDAYLGEVVISNLLTGPGIEQRKFFNWTKQKNYPGLPTLSLNQAQKVDPDIVRPFVPLPATPVGVVTEIQSAVISNGDYSYFADQYVLANKPTLANTNYISEYTKSTHSITIQYVDGSVDVIAGGIYDAAKSFLVVNYYNQVPSTTDAIIVGSNVPNIVDANLLPLLTDYSLFSNVNTGLVNYTRNYNRTVDKTYSDGSPSSTTTTAMTDIISFNGTHKEYRKTVVEGGDPTLKQTIHKDYFYHLYELRQIYQDTTVTVTTNNLGNGVIDTVTTTDIGDHIRPVYNYNIDTQDTLFVDTGNNPLIWIYEIGTGNAALDTLKVNLSVTSAAEYYPYLPVRLDNVSITDPAYDSNTGSGLYDKTAATYKRASGGNDFADLVTQVDNNPDIAEIDYAYIQFGVSLNTTENASKKYLYQFFKDLIPHQNTDSSYMTSFMNGVLNYTASVAALAAWNSNSGTPKPIVPTLEQPETTTIQLVANDPSLQNFDNRITWVNIDEQLFTGLGKTGAKPGEVWLSVGSSFNWDDKTGVVSVAESLIENKSDSMKEIKIFWQTGANNYKVLTIWGLTHQNFIYGGKYVEINGHDALNDPDVSGFIVPLHNPTIKSMSLKDSTQMTVSNIYIVFNSYKIFQKKWYQTFLGMLLIIVLMVVIAVVISPTAIGGVTGAFGTNIAVGTSLGFTGTAAIVAGAVTNAVAAMIISSAITTFSTNVFGEKWGAIIGAVLSFVVNFGISNGFSALNIQNLLTPKNLLGISSALANGYSGFSNSVVSDINAEMFDNTNEFNKKMEEINKLLSDLGLNNDLSFDPLQLTDSVKGNDQENTGSYVPESLDEFIHRTTMTGSDIVEITLALVKDYANLNLELPRTA